MTSIEATSLFATLVSLICNWRDERGRKSDGDFQNFMTWLTNHKFEKLREQISQSEEVTKDLKSLLEDDLSSLDEKLNLITSTVVAVSLKLEQLSKIGDTLGVSTDAISDQAFGILKSFADSGAEKMIVFQWPISIAFDKRGGASPVLTVAEPRFLVTDIESLLATNLIRLTSYNNSGDPIYSLTRSGYSLAQSIQNPGTKDAYTPFE
jgi:hypothetical protein